MRIVLQRVSKACVRVEGRSVGKISAGLVLLVAIERDDSLDTLAKAAEKVLTLRIFADEGGRMNRSVLDTKGEILVISQFTLAASTRRGRRPSFNQAAPQAQAKQLIDAFSAELEDSGLRIALGRFGAEMQVELVNDGPVTFYFEFPG